MHTVLVGGSKGLGRVLAKQFLKNGHQVSILARTPPNPEIMAEERISFFSTDLSTPFEVVKDSLLKMIDKNGLVDNLIFLQRSRLGSAEREKNWESEIQIMLQSTRLIIDCLAQSFSKVGGSIVMMTSMGGATYVDSQPIEYGVCKAGINQMVRHYCVVLGKLGIRVNGVSCFSFIKDSSRDYFNRNIHVQGVVRKVVPLGRMADAADIANVVRFLCSPDASFVSGQIVVVDGGLSALNQETIAFRVADMRGFGDGK